LKDKTVVGRFATTAPTLANIRVLAANSIGRQSVTIEVAASPLGPLPPALEVAFMFDLLVSPLLIAQEAMTPQAANDWWTEQLFGLDKDERFVLLVVVVGCITGIILGSLGIISSLVGTIQRRRSEVDLKREMLDRGMSADEIAKVIEAATLPEDGVQRWIATWGGKKR
jgi:hypothetical protein